MNGKIIITRELMEQARDYIPLAEKEAWVAENAPKVFDKLAITSDGEPLPPMYMVNTGLKSRYLMAALVGLYFGFKTAEPKSDDDADIWLMSVDDYDDWAGSHVFNQLERLKRDGELKTKAYDLMFDYKDLEKRFSAQISSLLAVQNDPVIRQNEMMAAQVKQLPVVMEQLNALQEKKMTNSQNNGGARHGK